MSFMPLDDELSFCLSYAACYFISCSVRILSEERLPALLSNPADQFSAMWRCCLCQILQVHPGLSGVWLVWVAVPLTYAADSVTGDLRNRVSSTSCGYLWGRGEALRKPLTCDSMMLCLTLLLNLHCCPLLCLSLNQRPDRNPPFAHATRWAPRIWNLSRRIFEKIQGCLSKSPNSFLMCWQQPGKDCPVNYDKFTSLVSLCETKFQTSKWWAVSEKRKKVDTHTPIYYGSDFMYRTWPM